MPPTPPSPKHLRRETLNLQADMEKLNPLNQLAEIRWEDFLAECLYYRFYIRTFFVSACLWQDVWPILCLCIPRAFWYNKHSWLPWCGQLWLLLQQTMPKICLWLQAARHPRLLPLHRHRLTHHRRDRRVSNEFQSRFSQKKSQHLLFQ